MCSQGWMEGTVRGCIFNMRFNYQEETSSKLHNASQSQCEALIDSVMAILAGGTKEELASLEQQASYSGPEPEPPPAVSPIRLVSCIDGSQVSLSLGSRSCGLRLEAYARRMFGEWMGHE